MFHNLCSDTVTNLGTNVDSYVGTSRLLNYGEVLYMVHKLKESSLFTFSLSAHSPCGLYQIVSSKSRTGSQVQSVPNLQIRTVWAASFVGRKEWMWQRSESGNVLCLSCTSASLQAIWADVDLFFTRKTIVVLFF